MELKEATERGDNRKIIECLIRLREYSTGLEIDRSTFKVLIHLITVTNPKIINYSLSILANCCLKSRYRKMFLEMNGVPHLLLVLKIIEDDSIISRGCRLIGNLSVKNYLVEELCYYNAGLTLANLFERKNLSTETLIMLLRAIGKLWTHAEVRSEMTSDAFSLSLMRYLNSDDKQVVCEVLQSLFTFTSPVTPPTNEKLKVTKDLFLKIIELAKDKDYNSSGLYALSNLICHQEDDIWRFLEGSNITEAYIEYITNIDNVHGTIYLAFCKLCREGAVRNQVRLAGLLPRLIKICNEFNVKEFLATLYLFQYDIASMTECASHPKFISILTKNIALDGAVQLLAVVSRLSPPVKSLLLPENLEVIIKSRACHGILRNIVRNKEFLGPILTSGKVWEIEKAGCSMAELGNHEYSAALIDQLLNNEDSKTEENVFLAIPFLVEPGKIMQLYRLEEKFHVLAIISDLLEENPYEEQALASVLRLIQLFRLSYDSPESFFNEFCGNSSSASSSTDHKKSYPPNPYEKEDYSYTFLPDNSVTFELDNGDCVEIDKSILCKHSPVFDSMLNGSFMEAKQDKVSLRNSSTEAFMFLVQLLKGELKFSDIEINIYLELLSLTDRFLITKLNNTLTDNLRIDARTCPVVYGWHLQAGFTPNILKIRRKLYEFIFSSTDSLLLLMKSPYSTDLMREISEYFSKSIRRVGVNEKKRRRRRKKKKAEPEPREEIVLQRNPYATG